MDVGDGGWRADGLPPRRRNRSLAGGSRIVTVWARAVRCLMALALAVSGALLPSRGEALADASTPRSVPATTANSAACAYDATAVAHADVHANDTGVSVSQQEVGSRQVSAPPSARVLGASTISSRRCVATNTADDIAAAVTRPAGVADDFVSQAANNGKGTVWRPPGTTGNAGTVRIMEPTTQYPNGYVRFYNEGGQPIGLNGMPGPNPVTHIPLNPDGTYSIPKGWGAG